MVLLRGNIIGLAITIPVILLLIVTTYSLTKGFAFYYIDKQGTFLNKVLTYIHFGISILVGLILPNNYLNKIDWINTLYSKNGFWIPISMLLVAILSLTLIGSLISFIYYRKKK